MFLSWSISPKTLKSEICWLDELRDFCSFCLQILQQSAIGSTRMTSSINGKDSVTGLLNLQQPSCSIDFTDSCTKARNDYHWLSFLAGRWVTYRTTISDNELTLWTAAVYSNPWQVDACYSVWQLLRWPVNFRPAVHRMIYWLDLSHTCQILWSKLDACATLLPRWHLWYHRNQVDAHGRRTVQKPSQVLSQSRESQ